MGMNNVMTSFFLFSTLYLLFIHQLDNTSTAAESPNRAESHRRNRPFVPFPPRMPYIKLKNEPFNDLIVDDDDFFELSKRQNSDDYGHLRFGKRGEEGIDDYGYMRLGRNGAKN